MDLIADSKIDLKIGLGIGLEIDLENLVIELKNQVRMLQQILTSLFNEISAMRHNFGVSMNKCFELNHIIPG